jgi:hypothetical protein
LIYAQCTNRKHTPIQPQQRKTLKAPYRKTKTAAQLPSTITSPIISTLAKPINASLLTKPQARAFFGYQKESRFTQKFQSWMATKENTSIFKSRNSVSTALMPFDWLPLCPQACSHQNEQAAIDDQTIPHAPLQSPMDGCFPL